MANLTEVSDAMPAVPAPAVPNITAPAVPAVPAPAVPNITAPAVPEVPAPAVPNVTAPAVPEVPAPATPEVPAPAEGDCPAECMAPVCVTGNVAIGGQPLLTDSLPSRCPYSCSAPDDAGRRYCGTGSEYTGADSTDCSKCSKATPPGPCIVQGYYYYPQSHIRFPKDMEETWESCQLRCKSDPYCQFFGYWPDKGCHVQGKGAELYHAQSGCPADQMDSTCAGSLVISGPEQCAESTFTAYPDTATAKPALPDVVFGDCTEVGFYYTPKMGTETKLATWRDCQLQCKNTPECKTFSFWESGGCVMQGANTTKVNSTEQCLTSATGTTDGSCAGNTVISGPGECPDIKTENNCTATGYEWEPLGPKTSTTSMEMCRSLCYGDLSCQKFSYWPDGGCHFQAANATLKKSTGDMSDQVVAGSQLCGYAWHSLYPDVSALERGVTPPVAPSPGPGFLATTPEPKMKSSGGGFPWGWLILALAIFGIIVAVALYGSGMCDEEKKKKKKKKSPSRRDLVESTQARKAPETKPLVSEEKPLPTSTEAVPAYQPVPQVVTGSPVASGQQFVASNRQVVQVGTPVAYQQQSVQTVQQPVQVVQQVQAATLFDMMDRNHDGVVSAAEFHAATGR